jgi:hypothetical protein
MKYIKEYALDIMEGSFDCYELTAIQRAIVLHQGMSWATKLVDRTKGQENWKYREAISKGKIYEFERNEKLYKNALHNFMRDYIKENYSEQFYEANPSLGATS